MHHSCGHTHFHRHYQDQGISGRSDTGHQTGSAPAKSEAIGPSHREIAELAYSYWEARGQRDGSQWEDWFRAERELRQKA